MKNPNAKLEQLRRSSLVEFEHLTKDPHPDPPLRALPEHSVLHDEDISTARPALSGGASPHGLDHFGGFDGIADEASTQAAVRNITQQQSVSKTTEENVTQGSGTSEKSKINQQATNEGLFNSSQGASSTSSSFFGQTTSSSNSQQTFSSSGQQVQSGKMTFTLPDFGNDNKTEVADTREEILSPTQPQDEGDEKKGYGLF
jgi:glycogenin glucosyltransferase